MAQLGAIQIICDTFSALFSTVSLRPIDVHRGREGGGTSCTPSKDFEKFGHKNAKNTKIDPHPPFPPDFLTTPRTPQNNLKKTVHLCFKHHYIQKNCFFKLMCHLG